MYVLASVIRSLFPCSSTSLCSPAGTLANETQLNLPKHMQKPKTCQSSSVSTFPFRVWDNTETLNLIGKALWPPLYNTMQSGLYQNYQYIRAALHTKA